MFKAFTFILILSLISCIDLDPTSSSELDKYKTDIIDLLLTVKAEE